MRRENSRPKIVINPEPTWVDGSLGDNWSNELNGCDVLVHLAAAGVIPSNGDSSSCFDINVVQSEKLWRLAAKSGVRKLLICGSCFEYGKAGERYELIPADSPLIPTGSYHASKAAASMLACALAIECGLSLEIVRPFHVYGIGEHPDRFWPSLRSAAISGKDFEMTDGLQVRDFIDVVEVANKILISAEGLIEAPPGVAIRNIGSGFPQSLIEFAREWWKHFEASGKLVPGAVKSRSNEVKRYVACLKPVHFESK